MAQTDNHSVNGNVKAQEEIKAELLNKLNGTADAVANLTAQLEEIEGMLEPEPRPFPENVPLSALQFNLHASAQRENVYAAMDGLSKALQEMLREAKNSTYGVQHLRNSRAWTLVMEKACVMLNGNFRAVDEAVQAMATTVSMVAMLATFARADTVPEAEKAEGEAA